MPSDPAAGQPPPADGDLVPGDAPAHPPTQASGVRDAGRYQIGEVIADGLHRGRDRVLDRAVQLRVADSAAAGELEREARFAARLAHPGVVPVHDFVRGDGGALLVQDDIVGPTLAEAVAAARAGRPPPALASVGAAVLAMRQVCDALAAAHARGVVHRNLDPQRIILGEHGRVVVTGWDAAMRTVERPLTRRFVATAAAAEKPDLDDLHADVRAVGACLFEALVLRPPAGADPCAGLAAAERMRLPEALAPVIRQALATTPAGGYRDMAALGEDLGRFLSGLPALAYDPGVWRGFRAWEQRRRRRIAATAVAVVLAAAAAAAGKAWVDRWYDRWGPALVSETFADGTWRERWTESSKGAFLVAKERLVSQAPAQALLIFNQRLVTPVAIEYTGQILPGAKPCDLSVWWVDRDGIPPDPARMSDGAQQVYMVQAGANDNTNCAIFQVPPYRRVAHSLRQLEVGRDYRFRIEIDGERVTLDIDGKRELEYRSLFPTASGYVMLYGYYPGKAFDDVSIYQKAVARAPSPTMAGDALYQFRHFADAASVYGRTAEAYAGQAVGEQALFRKGLAERELKLPDASRTTWSGLHDRRLAGLADAFQLEDLVAGWQVETAALRFDHYYRERPELRPELRQEWQQLIKQAQSDPRWDEATVMRLVGLRDNLFPEDSATAYEATAALLRLGRYQDILTGYADERSAVMAARLALGRTDEALADPLGRTSALLIRGEFDRLDAIPGLESTVRAMAMCKRGWAREAIRDTGETYPALIQLGQAEALLAALPTRTYRAERIAGECLIALGRDEEAAGAGLPAVPRSGRNPRALLLLGRIDEAEQAFQGVDYWNEPMPVAWARLLAAAAAGDQAGVAAWKPKVGPPASLAYPSGWFAGTVIATFVDGRDGDRAALKAGLERAVAAYPQVFGKRAWLVARYALGQCDDQAVLVMPAASEGPAWLAVGKALRAELAGSADEALAAYRAFTAMPRHQRLLDGNTLDVQVELFVAWRLRALAGSHPAP